jgi:hypothetical protein
MGFCLWFGFVSLILSGILLFGFFIFFLTGALFIVSQSHAFFYFRVGGIQYGIPPVNLFPQRRQVNDPQNEKRDACRNEYVRRGLRVNDRAGQQYRKEDNLGYGFLFLDVVKVMGASQPPEEPQEIRGAFLSPAYHTFTPL